MVLTLQVVNALSIINVLGLLLLLCDLAAAPAVLNTGDSEVPDEQNAAFFIPEQIHISLGGDWSEMVIVWSTHTRSSSLVSYGLRPDDLDHSASGECVEFSWMEENPEGMQFLHRVKLMNLLAGTAYSYRAESDDQKSPVFTFTTISIAEDWSPTLMVFGDMGYDGGAPSYRLLSEVARTRSADAVIHFGDFAYDLHSEGGKVGDAFMNRIQEIASIMPYMTCPGNHEIHNGFSHYRYRFSMPTLPWPMQDRLWFSFNVGKAHFVSYSTEVYFTDGPITEQYKWLRQDLEEANKPENREKRPWIIAFGHRAMYCSNGNNDDCTHTLGSKVRDGLEELFFSQGVDIIFQGHEHSYERLWPVYKEQVYAENYTNPRAPVHIIGGAAGCNDWYGACVDPILFPRGPWSAFRSWLPGLYGIGRLQIHNTTHVHWQQLLAVNGQVMDDVWIEQHNHGKFTTHYEAKQPHR